jgi:hypothetical protein
MMSASGSNSVIGVMSAARPLFPRKRKSIRGVAMSQTCQKRTLARLFDHLVGEGEQLVGHVMRSLVTAIFAGEEGRSRVRL